MSGEAADREHVAAAYSCVGSFAYAVTGALAHALKNSCSWELLSVTRGLSMMLFAGVAMALAGVRPVFREPSLWIRSLAGSATTLCTFYAWTRLPIADVTTLVNTVPIWVAILSGLLLKERIGLGGWVAVAMAFAGVVLIQRPHWHADGGGVAGALGAGLAGSFSVVGLRRAKHLDARAVVLHMSVVVSAVAALTFWLRGADAFIGEAAGASGGAQLKTFALLGSLGLFVALAQYTITRAYALGQASRVTVLGVLGVFFAAVLDRVFWNRHFELSTILGMVLVSAPSAWLTTHAARAAWNRRGRVGVPATLIEAEPAQDAPRVA